ncbi:MAG: T9SS type A sorting domain-containing protein [Flavobacteriales bacterium]|nr:T9SS type A sorting domain-containing protein [Flavobacteriales bacterium]
MNRLTSFLLIIAVGLVGSQLRAQTCSDNNVTQFAVVTPACPGTVNTNNVPSGNYLTVNITAGNTYTFSTCGSGFNTLLTLWNGGTYVAQNDDAGGACGNRSILTWTATYTGTIKLNLDRNTCGHTGGTANISTTCAAPPANDNPCGAVVLPVGASCSSTAGTNVGASATASIPAPGCAAYTTADVWFSFVAPASGRITLGTTANTLTDAGMAIYSATACAGTFNLEECDDNDGTGNMPAIQRTGLTPLQTYYVRVWGNSGATGSFSICAWDSPPANDAPCAATALAVGTSCSNTAATNLGAYATAGIPAPTCGTYTYSDVWFTIVAPASGHINVSTTAGTLTDAAMAVYSATACNGTFTQIGCNDNANGGNMPALDLNGLTPGQTYYARVWGNGERTGSFSICAYDMTGDAPCTAVSLPVNTTCVNTTSTNVGASLSADVPAPGCGNLAGGDVWFSFVAPASGAVIIGSSGGSIGDGAMALYSATACAGTFTLITCSDDVVGYMPQIMTSGLTPGVTYYLRYWGYGGASGSFDLCVQSFIPNPIDNPCSAQSISPSTACSFTTYTNVNATLTPSLPNPGCGGVASGVDVWFTFTAPPSGFVTIKTQAGTLTDASMALYRATSCSLGMTLVDCDDNNGIGTMPFLSFSDLVGGSTYYLRVWGNGGATGSFDLCIVQPATSGTCFYALNMQDEIGDGWGGSTVGISINGGAYTNYTLTNGERDVVYIPITVGQLVMLQYTAAGGAQNEITYSLQLGGGALHSAGPTPATGLVYTGVADCNPPDAPTSDCRGSDALCAATSFNGSPSNTGLVADLNFTTRGCLGANERQGIWYNFTISAGGTLAFTITPNNAGDDYDFAVFGPFLSVDCVNKNAPLRCSFSGTSGNTGLRASAVDLTEDSSGDKWVAPIAVSVGEVYMLYVSNFSLSGLQFGLSWQMAGGASIDCTVLPIELTAFDAVAIDEQVDVNWITATELNNDHFEIERSSDALNFERVAQVNGAGNSQSALEYAWRDADPLPGTSYYRLKQVDLDGQFSYSPVRPVTLATEPNVIRPYPNPVRDLLYIPLGSNDHGNTTVRIIDAKGTMVRNEQRVLGDGSSTLTIPVGSLSPGSYAVQVIGAFDTGIRSGRFVIE